MLKSGTRVTVAEERDANTKQPKIIKKKRRQIKTLNIRLATKNDA